MQEWPYMRMIAELACLIPKNRMSMPTRTAATTSRPRPAIGDTSKRNLSRKLVTRSNESRIVCHGRCNKRLSSIHFPPYQETRVQQPGCRRLKGHPYCTNGHPPRRVVMKFNHGHQGMLTSPIRTPGRGNRRLPIDWHATSYLPTPDGIMLTTSTRLATVTAYRP